MNYFNNDQPSIKRSDNIMSKKQDKKLNKENG